jgi:hypothetical protein
MVSRSKWRGTVSIDVDLNTVLEEIDTEALVEELRARNKAVSAPVSFDLLDELHFCLRRGKVQDALALIDSALNARIISDAQRQAQFQRDGHPAAH